MCLCSHYPALFGYVSAYSGRYLFGLGFSQAIVITGKDGDIQRDTQSILQTIKLAEPVPWMKEVIGIRHGGGGGGQPTLPGLYTV